MSFPISPTNGQTAVFNGITYSYNSTKGAWVRVPGVATTLFISSSTQSTGTNTGALVVAGGVGVGGNVYFGGNLYQNGVLFTGGGTRTILNDISAQCDGIKAVFPLRTDQTDVTGIVDSKDLEVLVNGIRITPYVTEARYPWITPYDSYSGFRAVTTGTSSTWLVIYNAPELSSQVTVTQLNSSSSKQSRRYPYSATSIALGD